VAFATQAALSESENQEWGTELIPGDESRIRGPALSWRLGWSSLLASRPVGDDAERLKERRKRESKMKIRMRPLRERVAARLPAALQFMRCVVE
jgi:hypothetical protein